MEELVNLLDRLEGELAEAKRLPSGVKPIVEQMRSALQDQSQAREMLDGAREQALAQARQEADSVVAKAREEAEQLSAQHEIVQAAMAQAQEIRSGADEYAFEVLCQLEQELNRTLTVIANGLRTLQDKRGATAPKATPSEDRQHEPDGSSGPD
jgi:uncharacterized coiled-coil DUF342 family protein